MLFTYDTDVTLAHAAAVANTGPGLGDEDREELPDLAALQAWFDRWEWTGRRPASEAELTAVRALRPRLRHLWSLRDDDLVAEANALLAENGALPRLVKHGHFGWHVHATSDDATLDRRIAVEVGMALVDVIRGDEVDRLQGVRRRRLRGPAHRPQQEPLPQVLRRDVRHPRERRRLPGEEGRRGLTLRPPIDQ